MSGVKSRREVLAFIALADLPTPKEVRFRSPWADGSPALTIELDTSPQLLSWVRLFTGDDDAQHEPGIPVAGGTAISYTEYADWGGYHIMLSADDPVGTADPGLDEATRGQLQQLVDQEVVTGPAALAGNVPGEVYERDEPTVRAEPPCDPCTEGQHCQQCGCCDLPLYVGYRVGGRG